MQIASFLELKFQKRCKVLLWSLFDGIFFQLAVKQV